MQFSTTNTLTLTYHQFHQFCMTYLYSLTVPGFPDTWSHCVCACAVAHCSAVPWEFLRKIVINKKQTFPCSDVKFKGQIWENYDTGTLEVACASSFSFWNSTYVTMHACVCELGQNSSSLFVCWLFCFHVNKHWIYVHNHSSILQCVQLAHVQNLKSSVVKSTMRRVVTVSETKSNSFSMAGYTGADFSGATGAVPTQTGSAGEAHTEELTPTVILALVVK